MTAAHTLYAVPRKPGTRGELNQMKRSGWVPGVIYNKEQENQTILLEGRMLKRVFTHSGTRGVFNLQIEGEKTPVMVIIREIQKNPVGNELSHIDFLPLKSDEKVHNTVSIRIAGEEELIAQGKMLQVMTKDVEVSCLPGHIPEYIPLEVSILDIGDKITMADLSLSPVIELLEDPATIICIVTEPARMDTDLEPTAEEPAETAE